MNSKEREVYDQAADALKEYPVGDIISLEAFEKICKEKTIDIRNYSKFFNKIYSNNKSHFQILGDGYLLRI